MRRVRSLVSGEFWKEEGSQRSASADRQVVGSAAPGSTRTTAYMNVIHGPMGAAHTEAGYELIRHQRRRFIDCKEIVAALVRGISEDGNCLESLQ